jgi:phosphatidylserine/phosphatidylglycerophosphate/cardiolipin synthase-like enzyme
LEDPYRNPRKINSSIFFRHDPAVLSGNAQARLQRLYTLLTSQNNPKLEVKVLPNEVFGLIHGKAGVITLSDGSRTCFLGSANETYAGWNLNYELVWEDDSEEACTWVQEDFRGAGKGLSQNIVIQPKKIQEETFYTSYL